MYYPCTSFVKNTIQLKLYMYKIIHTYIYITYMYNSCSSPCRFSRAKWSTVKAPIPSTSVCRADTVLPDSLSFCSVLRILFFLFGPPNKNCPSDSLSPAAFCSALLRPLFRNRRSVGSSDFVRYRIAGRFHTHSHIHTFTHSHTHTHTTHIRTRTRTTRSCGGG